MWSKYVAPTILLCLLPHGKPTNIECLRSENGGPAAAAPEYN